MTQTIEEMEEILNFGVPMGIAFSLKMKGKSIVFVGIERYNKRNGLHLLELKPQTLYGTRIEETVFHISEVERITLLNVYYDDPVYVRLRTLKGMINAI